MVVDEGSVWAGRMHHSRTWCAQYALLFQSCHRLGECPPAVTLFPHLNRPSDPTNTQMLYRAVALTCVTGWTIDRLYEAGADETVSFLSMQLATPQAGALLAAAGCTAASLAFLVQRSLFPVQLIAKAEKELEAAEGVEEERAAKEAKRAALAPAPEGMGGSRREVKRASERVRMRKVLEKVSAGWGGEGVGFAWG